MKITTVYRQAASAVLLPLLCIAFCATPPFAALAHYMLRRDLTTWLAVFAIGALALVELEYLVDLVRFIVVKGNPVAYAARLSDPVRVARRRTRRFRATTVALSIALGLGLMEAVFRIWNIQPPPIAYPHYG